MKFFDSGHAINITWSIYKGASGIKENFAYKANNTRLAVMLLSVDDSICLDYTISDGNIVAQTPDDLEDGVYGIQAIWVKNENKIRDEFRNNRNILRSTVDNIFSIDMAQPSVDAGYSVSIQSSVHTFGYDGLSVYELALLHGLTDKRESIWLADGVTKDYDKLANLPAIGGKTLDKNSTAESIGLATLEQLNNKQDVIEDLEDIRQGVKSVLKESVSVIGGPLAGITAEDWPEEWMKDGNPVIPEGVSFRDFASKMFFKKIDGTLSAPVYVWQTGQGMPDITITGVTAGYAHVGKRVRATAQASSLYNNIHSVSCHATGDGQFGYYDNDVHRNEDYNEEKVGSVTGTATVTLKHDNAAYTPNSDITVTAGQHTFNAKQSGRTASAPALTVKTLYPLSNTGEKVNSGSVQIEADTRNTRQLTSEKNVSYTGIYPVGYGTSSLTFIWQDSKVFQDITINESGAQRAVFVYPKGRELTVDIWNPLANSYQPYDGDSETLDDVSVTNDDGVQMQMKKWQRTGANLMSGKYRFTLTKKTSEE